MSGRRLLLLLAAAWGAAPARAAPGEAGREYVFAVVPQAPPVVTSARWSPIVARLSARSGVPIQLKLYETFEQFQADVAAGAVDLAYLHPIQAVQAHQAARYRPLLRNSEPVHGVLFVARDAPYTDVASLKGTELAFVGPSTFCSVTLRHELAQVGAVHRYVGTSANVTKHVALGLTQGGGLLDVAFRATPPEVRDRLRVIYTTPPMAPHALVAHPRVPRAVRERIAGALVALAATDEGADLLGPLHFDRPIAADYARDYAPIAHMLEAPARAGPASPER